MTSISVNQNQADNGHGTMVRVGSKLSYTRPPLSNINHCAEEDKRQVSTIAKFNAQTVVHITIVEW